MHGDDFQSRRTLDNHGNLKAAYGFINGGELPPGFSTW
jgi:hypothetical protein